MQHFLSVHDVPDINRLMTSALAYKANPLKDQTLGAGKADRIALSKSLPEDPAEYPGGCPKPGYGSHRL